MRKYLILLALASLPAMADELSLDINLHAHHFNRAQVAQYNLNEVNPGVGLRWTDGDYHKMVGVYRNSIRRDSAYALMAWTPIHLGTIKVGAVAGVVTGYTGKPYMPAAGLYAIVPVTDRVSVNVTIVPTISAMQVIGFVGFQGSFKF